MMPYITMRINKFLIRMFIALFMVNIALWIHFFIEVKWLEGQYDDMRIYRLNDSSMAWNSVRIGIFLEFMKKQSFSLKQLEDGFTFYGNEFLNETDITDPLWQSLENDKIDMDYDKSFDRIMILEETVFLLFKDSILVDYRYEGNRNFLIEYLKKGGDIPPDD
jgi:hypothetical protein